MRKKYICLTHSLAILAFCLLWPQPAFSEQDRIKLGGSTVLSVLPLVAAEEGIFAKHNLDVEFVKIQIGKLAMDAVLSDSVDFGVIVDTNLAFNSFTDSELRAVASILKFSTNGLIYRKSAGIDRIADLRGKRIGYLPATTSHIFLIKLLNAHQLTMNDVQAVVLQAPSMLPAMRTETVDAVSIWDPWRFQIGVALGAEVVDVPNAGKVYQPRAFLAAKSSMLASRADVTRRLLAALTEAEQFVGENLGDIQKRYAKWNGMDADSLNSVWPQFDFKVELSKAAYEVVEDDIAIISSTISSFTKKKPRAISEIFEASFLSAINPTRVEKIK